MSSRWIASWYNYPWSLTLTFWFVHHNYTVNVESGGRTYIVAVPPGGVQAGQRFEATVLSEQQGGMVDQAMMMTGGGTGKDPHNIPSGHWRDGLW